ncbi:hypothetical protein JXM67_13820 [candidate division WOR-3 bacterium]|nr:hypothetical protein [candidate division WOR-3 bacterium]
MQSELPHLSKSESERFVMEQLTLALKEKGYEFVHHFRFLYPRGRICYLVFVTKAFIGYHKMKEIMAKESTYSSEGVPSYEYNPADKWMQRLDWGDDLIEKLNQSLLKEYSGQELTVLEIYEKHSVNRKYILKNYKDGLKKLESQDIIETNPPADERRKNTMADTVKIKFPRKGQ